MVHLDWRNWLYICICSPFKNMKKIKGIFKPLKRYFKCSFSEWDYYPVIWISNPAFIHIMSSDVMWKSKYDTPRFENVPYIWIHLWKLNLIWYWSVPKFKNYDNEEYWEQALWYLYYYGTYEYGLLDAPDIEAARNSWPWIEYNEEESKSSWKDKYLLNSNENKV